MKQQSKFNYFLKKNAFYFVLGLCILAIGLSVTLVILLRDNPQNSVNNPPVIDTPVDDVPDIPDIPVDEPDIPTDVPETPVDTKIVFCMPVNNGSVIKDYVETMVFNSTLNKYTVHLAMDFSASAGSDVVCVYDGVIESITSNYLTGTTIVIDHGNDLKTVYNSLESSETISVGQTLKKGDIIGQVVNTNLTEYNDGAHLHFEVMEKGENVNPLNYLLIEEK